MRSVVILLLCLWISELNVLRTAAKWQNTIQKEIVSEMCNSFCTIWESDDDHFWLKYVVL
jgi:hypothetical protein